LQIYGDDIGAMLRQASCQPPASADADGAGTEF